MEHVLSNGNKIPLIGLGTFKIRANVDEGLVTRLLDVAITKGYRLIDTASCYRNEVDIGKALQKIYEKYGISRQDIFITSKIAPKDLSFDGVIQSCEQSMKDLQTDYIDLLLIHWPGKAKLKPDDDGHVTYRRNAWQALEQLYDQGSVRNIGVSNFTVKHLEELLLYARIRPVVNQVELHPYLTQCHLCNYCRQEQIFVQAYSSLGTGELLKDCIVKKVANKYGKTPAQILLKWAVQQSIGVLPKSTHENYVISNFDINTFEIKPDDMRMLRELNNEKHYCWDPTKIK